MNKAFLLLFVWGPAMLGYALGWLIHHPTDWSGPAVVAPLGALLTLVTYRWGTRKMATVGEDLRAYFVVGMASSAVIGLAIFGMLALRLIG